MMVALARQLLSHRAGGVLGNVIQRTRLIVRNERLPYNPRGNQPCSLTTSTIASKSNA